MDPAAEFAKEVETSIEGLAKDTDLKGLSRVWLREVTPHRYPYNFTWLGRPIIQLPQDVVALQEIIWRVKPDLIIETGVAHGGSLVLSASLLHLIGGGGRVVGIDIEIRPHNRVAIETHPLASRIVLVEGSSTAPDVVAKVKEIARGAERIMVILDSNHTHSHVLHELEAYSGLVTQGSYLVVLDTLIEDMPVEFFKDRPWKPGNSPKTAVRAFLEKNDRFVVDRDLETKLLLTVAPDGYLKCVKDP